MNVVALQADFRRAGRNGLAAPWEAPWLAERVARRFGVGPDDLVAAHHEGLCERARLAVQRHVDGLGDPEWADPRALLETAAQAADLPAEGLLDIVWEIAPDACSDEGRKSMLGLAEMALHDFQRIPARQRNPCPEQDQTAMDRSFLEEVARPILARGKPLPPEIGRLAAASLLRLTDGKETNVTLGNLAGVRLATFMGEPVQRSAALEARDEPQAESGPSDEWRPRDIADPAMWPNPANMPPSLRGLAYVDFDPTIETPPPAWLAKGLLPRTGIGLLFGESGAGKSFAAIYAALSVAWGLPLFGAKVKQGAVLYIAAEGGKSVLRRFKAANRELDGAVAAANVCRTAGAASLTRAPIRIVHEAPDLSRDGDPAPLVRAIRDAEAEFAAAGDRLALVVIDTWHAAMGGGDENSAADAGHALKPLIAASERGSFLTLIVHHPGKDSDRGARGSNALPAAADAIIAITVPGFEGAKAKPSSAMRQATVTKMRDGEAGGGFNYRLGIVPIGIDEDGDAVTTCVVEPCDAPKLDEDGLSANDRELMTAVRAALAEGAAERAKVEEVRLRFYAMRPDAKADARRMAWQRALKRATSTSRIATDDHDLFIWIPEHPEHPTEH